MDSLSTSDKARFLRQRWIVYASMFVGWSCFVLVRRILPSSTSSLIQHQGFTREDIGMIISSFSSGYGVSKFLSSILSDHCSPRILFSIGLMLSGFSSILFPVAKNAWTASLVWLLTGVLQGCGWAPCAVLLKSWYPPSHLGRWWSILSSAGNVATAMSPLIIIYISSVSDWTTSYYVCGLATFTVGCIVFMSIKDNPSEIGVKINFGDASSSATTRTKEDSHRKSKDQSSKHSWYSVFFIYDLWIVGVVYACVYAVKDSLLGWSLLYFTEVSGKSKESAAACTGVTQVGGLLGNIVIGSLSDAFITPRTQQSKCPRAPVMFGVSLLMTLTVHLFRTTVDRTSSEFWLSALTFVYGFLMDGAVAVIGLCSMEVVPKSLAGSAHGLACALAQVGSFIAGWPFAYIIETYSWNEGYLFIEICSITMCMLCIYLLFLLVRGMRGS